METTVVECGKCGTRLDERSDVAVEERSPCPKCGSSSRKFGVHLASTVTLKSSLSLEHRHEFWERNDFLIAVVALITLGSPLLGLVLGGVPGVIVGLVVGVVGAAVGGKALVRVREINRSTA